MRFVFEEGGRSGCRNCEVLADFMETFEERTPPKSIVAPATLSFLHAGELRVHFEETLDGPGELFRTVQKQWSDWVRANNEGKTLRDVAAAYWAEAEAMAIERSAANAGERTKSVQATRL